MLIYLSLKPILFIMNKKLPKLTRRQRLFANYYIACNNASEAARRAGYSEKGANVTSSNLLSKINITEYIKIKTASLLAEIKENQLSTLRTIQNCAHFDIKDLYDEEGNLKNIHDIPDRTAVAICGITVKSDRVGQQTTDIKLSDRAKYLEMLAKAQGIYSDNAPVDLDLGIIVLPAKKEVGEPVCDDLLKRYNIGQKKE